MFYMFLISVTIQACKGHSFKGFLIQPRLAQFATQDVKIGVFGMYTNAPYQYTCPDTRNVSHSTIINISYNLMELLVYLKKTKNKNKKPCNR